MSDEEELERQLRESLKKVRPHASFFDWPIKQTKELGVLKEFIRTIGEDGFVRWASVRPGNPDPPDAIGELEGGAKIAIEITELVDQRTAEHNVRAMRESQGEEPIERMKRLVVRYWDDSALKAAITERLRAKDGATLQGGPFQRYVVLLHTDEPTLMRADVERWLNGHVFAGLSSIDDAYLLFSYDPASDNCPVLRINVAR